MSLDTVLKIGKALRGAENSLKYFKYVASPKNNEGEYPLCLTIPVKEDWSFDWNNVKIIPENERENLFYLNLKTSDQDSSPKKYLFGDIYFKRSIKRNNKKEIISTDEYGNFLLTKSNSFENAVGKDKKKSDLIKYLKDNIDNFSESNLYKWIENFKKEKNRVGLILCNSKVLEEDLSKISSLSIQKSEESEIFLHFDFSGKNWYELDEFNLFINYLNDAISSSIGNKIVFTKSVYRTLCSGDDKNDIQFPYFQLENRQKSFAFDNNEEFLDFLYADRILKRPISYLRDANIDLYVFPAFLKTEETIPTKDYEDFFFSKRDESRINLEPVFPTFLDEDYSKIKRFDFVFADSSGKTTKDLIEISGIEKSKLRQTKERIEQIASTINQKRKEVFFFAKDLLPISIGFSLLNILGGLQSDKGAIAIKPNAKYRSHLLKTLPLIYTDNYYQDGILLPACIQNIEFVIRNADEKAVSYKVHELRFQLTFLLKIQNTPNDNYMLLTESPSYQIGLKMGKLAKPLKNKINPFEKSYVGLLTRRTGNYEDCIAFLNEIDEMLVRHDKAWPYTSAEIREALANLPLRDYDKEKLAFGFFEGYFKYETTDRKKDFFNRLEKILTDYEGNEELQEQLEKLATFIEELKTETNS